MIRTTTLLLVCVLCALSAQAQTRYVSDELVINLRTGEGDSYRIKKLLKSGTRMTIVEEGSSRDWAKVRTQAGDEGWVRTQYLQTGPVARDLLVEANAKIASLTNQQQNLNSSSSELQTKNQDLAAKLAVAETQAARLSEELEELKRISANAVTLNSTNQKLMKERQLLETEIDLLKARNERLSDDSNQTWFLYGAIAVIIGVVLTLLLQNLRSRRRYSEWA